MKYLTIILASFLIVINTAFTGEDRDVEYGFISVSNTDNSKFNKYTLVDLKILDSLDAIYSCDLGGDFCQVNVQISNEKTKRSGSSGEIIEIETEPGKAHYSGEGFHFSFELKD